MQGPLLKPHPALLAWLAEQGLDASNISARGFQVDAEHMTVTVTEFVTCTECGNIRHTSGERLSKERTVPISSLPPDERTVYVDEVASRSGE